ncbi:hypothetical protein AB0O72_26180 [Streptomyces sp. NPDC088106]|uniref:hypothetical protein n=1 Tax=Streptomyces TaxID=1883 RepID=UPI003441A345
MSSTEKANDMRIVERHDLAERVAEALDMAGFTTINGGDSDSRPDARGVLVFVDPMTDSSGGVFVRWNTHPSLSRTVAQKVHSGGLQDPVFRHFSFVTEHMYTTLIAVLESAGFRAGDAEDDMSPYTIRVEDVPAPHPPRDA